MDLFHSVTEVRYSLSYRIALLIFITASKLSWVFSQFYLATNNNAQSCNFAGNATINPTAPTASSDVNAGVSSCLAATPDVFTPPQPTFTPGPVGSGTRSTHSGTGSSGSRVSLFTHGTQAILGLAITLLCAIGGGALLI